MHLNKLLYFTAIVSLMCFFASSAQDLQLSKEEAITLTLENNYGIEIAENNLDIAENNASIYNSGYLPQLYGLGGANYSNQSSAIVRGGEELPPLINAESENYNASINVDYLLFDGLGRYFNFKQLKEQSDLSRLEARETIENTILQLFSVYFEVARLTENVAVFKETLAISRQRVQRAQYQFEFGQNTKLEVLNAEVDVTTDSINLMNARQNLENTKRDLNLIMVRDLETDFMADTLVAFIPKLQLQDYLDEGIENNVRYLQAQRNIAISALDVKVAKSNYLPTIGLTGAYGWNQSISPPNPVFNAPASTRTVDGFSAGVNLRWDFFDGGNTLNNIRNAAIREENEKYFKDQVLIEVKRDIANAYGTYQNAYKVYEIQQRNVVTNQRNFERSRERFRLGQITSIEFRQAQINLINARTTKNLAKYDAKLAELQLLQQVGQLLNVEI